VRGHGAVDRFAIVGAVGRDRGDRAGDLLEQRGDQGGIPLVAGGQRGGEDLTPDFDSAFGKAVSDQQLTRLRLAFSITDDEL
jgi:hypothetical protein